tara:strand:+ start:34 stop:501 length:468 start_codon:yes stop_codon:yes gene_type:complete
MSYQNLRGEARAQVLLQAKRQMYRAEVEFSEDNRPVYGLVYLYQQLNNELFGGVLPCDLTVTYNSRLRRMLGKAFYRYEHGGNMVPVRIEIRSNHRWTNRFLRKVMIHEMCHIWAYQEHNEDGHGRMFWTKMRELGYPKTHDWDDSEHYERDIYC